MVPVVFRLPPLLKHRDHISEVIHRKLVVGGKGKKINICDYILLVGGGGACLCLLTDFPQTLCVMMNL